MRIYELFAYSPEGGTRVLVTCPYVELGRADLERRFENAMRSAAERMERNSGTTMECVLDELNDDDLANVGLVRVTPSIRCGVFAWLHAAGGDGWSDYKNELTERIAKRLSDLDFPELNFDVEDGE